MKHPIYSTILLGGWFLVAVLMGLVFPRFVGRQTTPVDLPEWFFIAFIIGMVAIGTLVWVFLMKKANPDTLVGIFSFVLGIAAADVMSSFYDVWWARVAIYVVVFGAMYWFIKRMQKDWAFVRYGYPIWNLAIAVVLAFASASVGNLIPPWAAICVLGLMAIYDALAVWKFKSMQKMAKGFLKLRIFPGMIVPYEKKRQFALLGGGDVFFVSLVGVSFYKTSLVMAQWVSFAMVASVWVLLALSQKRRFYPALPFIFAGCLVGLFGGWLFL